MAAGKLSVEEFLSQAGQPAIADMGDAQVDLDRGRRCGFPEVVFAEGKTVAAMEKIFDALLRHGAEVLATRISPEQATELAPRFPAGRYNAVGRTFRISPDARIRRAGRAGGDRYGRHERPAGGRGGPRNGVVDRGRGEMMQDVGVAGPHRLTANLPLLEKADAIVVVAGMEGALPSVVGGYVACPVIAVPTSIGYGASFGGVAALLGMLNSCASNVTVVNIDAGFKGGYVAGLIARNVARERANSR